MTGMATDFRGFFGRQDRPEGARRRPALRFCLRHLCVTVQALENSPWMNRYGFSLLRPNGYPRGVCNRRVIVG